jgi:hypothetical protein
LLFEKSKNILLCLLFSFRSCYSIGAWYSLYIIQATQVKSNNGDIWQSEMW